MVSSTAHSTSWATLLISFVAGVIFALGLIISQMADPNKVVAFLRVTQNWDPSLALVMGGAIGVATPAFLLAKRRQANNQPAFDGSDITLPNRTAITPSLLFGGVLFGIGWGILGFCPAPALVSAFAGYTQAMLFVAALFVGFGLHAWLNR